MKTHEVICQHCGEKFQSTRKDAKYCSDSCRVMASRDRKQEKMNDKTSITVKFSDAEYKQLTETAISAGISVQEMVKYRSLASLENIESKDSEIRTLKEKIKKLKAHLSIYAKDPTSLGIFIPVDEGFHIEIAQANMRDLMDKEKKRHPDTDEDSSLEDFMLYVLKNCQSL